MEHVGDGDTSCNWGTWNNSQRLYKGAGRVENKRTSRNHPVLLRLAGILKRVQETCCHSDSSERASANTGVKNLLGLCLSAGKSLEHVGDTNRSCST